MDFSVIARGGVTQGEFATLVGVSRVTANKWVRAKMLPHRYTKARIAAVLGHMQSAIQHGDLPLKGAQRGRLDELRAAVRRSVQRAKESASTS